MPNVGLLAAAVGRRLARLRSGIREAEGALAAGNADLALELTEAMIREHPGDVAVLGIRRRAFAARGELSNVAATVAALRRTTGGAALADMERRLHGDLAETDARWRPRVRGPRRPIEPRSDRVVLHLLKESRPQRQTGFTMRSHHNLLAQRAAGWDPVVVTALGFPRSGATEVVPVEEMGGIRHQRLDLGPGYPPDGPADAFLEDYAWRAAAVAREERPAIVHASSGERGYETALVGLAVGEHLDLPVVYEVRSLIDAPAPTVSAPAARSRGSTPAAKVSDATSTRERDRRRDATEVRSMLAADAIVTLAETLKSDIVARGVPAERVFIVPNGVDPEAFKPRVADPALRERYGLGDRFVIGYVSNLDHPREGQETLIEATALLAGAGRDVACLIVGEGRRRAEVESVAAASGAADRIVFTGAVPHDDVPAMYALLDAFVVPRRDERAARLVTPLKPFEAMAMARPLIVADLPALTEVAPDGERSLAYRAEDAMALAAAVVRLMDHPELAASLGENGRAWVTRERTWASNGPRWTQVYESVLAARRDRRLSAGAP